MKSQKMSELSLSRKFKFSWIIEAAVFSFFYLVELQNWGWKKTLRGHLIQAAAQSRVNTEFKSMKTLHIRELKSWVNHNIKSLEHLSNNYDNCTSSFIYCIVIFN